MALNIGSMLVKAKFEAGNMMSGLGAMNSRFKESQLASKQATTQFGRMKGSLLAMGATAALTGGTLLGMLMNAIMQSPFLAAAFEKLKVQMMLFGNAIARHLAPILEKVVDFVKWLREKFQGLPEPIQAGIVKFAALGIILLGLISTLGIFGFMLGAVKSGLLLLIPAGLATKLGALATAITGGSAASLLFAGLIGLVSGGLAVWALDEWGVMDWVIDLGERVGNLNNVLKDLILTFANLTKIDLGVGILDLIRGDFDFTMMKEAQKEADRAKYRLMTGTSATGGYAPQTWEAIQQQRSKEADFIGPPAPEVKTKIESQNNVINIDMSNIQGDVLDPATQRYIDEYTNRTLREYQEILNV